MKKENPKKTEYFRGIPARGYDEFKQIFPEYFRDGFVYGSRMTCDNTEYICINLERNTNNTYLKNGYITMVEVVPESIGRNTFILDKDGNPIYEGDIYERKHRELSFFPSHLTMAVVYDEDRACFAFADIDNPTNINFIKDYLTNQYQLKYIGDIHHNPEELTEEE